MFWRVQFRGLSIDCATGNLKMPSSKRELVPHLRGDQFGGLGIDCMYKHSMDRMCVISMYRMCVHTFSEFVYTHSMHNPPN
jgi:hypothetical protein